MMEWGLLPLDVATEVFAKKQGQKQGLKLKSPVKTPSAQRRTSSPTKKVRLLGDKKTNSGTKGKTTAPKKRKASSDTEDDDDDDDFVKTNSATKGKTTAQKRKKASSDTDDDEDDDFVMPKKPKKQKISS